MVGTGADGTHGKTGTCDHSHPGYRGVLRTLVNQRRTQAGSFPKHFLANFNHVGYALEYE